MNKTVKTVVEIVLLAAIAGLVYAIYASIMKPVNFNAQMAKRQAVAVQRLKDIRTLQVAFKSENGRFASTVDSLKDFYNNGTMKVVMQIGTPDDSLTKAHTEALRNTIKKKNRKITPAELEAKLYEMYLAGDKNIYCSIESKVPVKESVLTDRTDFCADSLKYIPFSDGQLTEMESTIRMVSGVPVPLFEARMPFKALLKGMDNQLRINLDAERRDQNKYEGLQVGSITAPNNNAGNWE